MTDRTLPVEEQDTTPACDVCPMLRKRLGDLEEAVETYFEVLNTTSAARNDAMTRVITALTVDFKDAILSSADMTDEQREFWLSEIAAHDAKTGGAS